MIDFEKNTPLVYYIFEKHYKGFSRYREDLIQCGMLGLLKACKRFQEAENRHFSTFAYKCIKNEMAMFLRRELRYWENTTDYMINEEDSILDIYEDKNQSYVVSKLNLKMFVDNCELLGEYIKGKTIKEISKEKGKSSQKVCDILLKEKKDLKELIKEA